MYATAMVASDALLSIRIWPDPGESLPDLTVTVFVDRGEVSADGINFARMAVKQILNGLAVMNYSCAYEQIPTMKPGQAIFSILVGEPVIYETATIAVVGPPAIITVSAAPARVRSGELVTVTTSVKDSIGQEVADGTLVSFEAPSDARLSEATLPTRRGTCTVFLSTNIDREGPYEVVAKSGAVSARARVVASIMQPIS